MATGVLNIFFTGATGYIGGSVLIRLLKEKTLQNCRIHTLVRTEEKAAILRSLGNPRVIPVIGTLDAATLLEKEASECDVFIHTADADHEGAIAAIIAGLKTRAARKEKKPILIHTSGTGVLIDTAEGDYASDKIYHDDKNDEINSLADTQPHRVVDLAVLGACNVIETFIIAPPTIWGLGVDFAQHSQQIPIMIKIALKNKRAYHVGKGANIWGHVHVEDLAEFYVLLLKKALEGKAPSGKDGFYFVENGEYNFKELANSIAKAMKKKGLTEHDTAAECSKEQAKEIFGAIPITMFAGNSRSRAVKGRKLEWNPKHSDVYGSIEPELESILKQGK